jgi:hypothetical protein
MPYAVLAATLVIIPLLAIFGARAEVVTAFVAIATLSVNHSFEHSRRRAEQERWYADRFIADKIESLKALFGVLDTWYWAANDFGNTPPSSLDEFRDRLGNRDAEFLAALSRAQLYLSAEDDKTIRMAMSALRRANIAIFQALPDSAFPEGRPVRAGDRVLFPWEDFLDNRDAAQQVISRHLNPRVLQMLEDSMR